MPTKGVYSISEIARITELERFEVATLLHEHDTPTLSIGKAFLVMSADFETMRPVFKAFKAKKEARNRRFAAMACG